MHGARHLILAAPDGTKDKSRSPKSRDEKSDQPSKKKANQVTGTFRKAAAGFGFVTPDGSTATDRSEDIFIPRHKTLDAAHLDHVKIRLSKDDGKSKGGKSKSGSRRDKSSGRVVEVLQRHTHRFVGSYTEVGNNGIVTVDGGTFDSGILVGDAGAKACKIGDKVVIEMANFPSAHQPGEGVIVEVLGDRGQPGVDTQMVIHEFGLPRDFPEAALEEARRQAELFDESISDDRTDFTGDTVVTIDPKTARDFDDAISLKSIKNGHWELGVHIADVSHFVPLRTPLDDEAYARGTSVYLPDRVIPMLPEIISNNLASLQPHRIRYCMTAVIEFNKDGVPIATTMHRGVIRSAHRFTYEEIDDYLADDSHWEKQLPPDVFTLVRDMHTLAMKLRRRRMKAGSINLVLPEVRIDLDDDGRVAGASVTENTESHQVIEEFMLAANEAVAQYMVDRGLNLLRRIHEQPSEAKTKELTEFVQHMGIESGNLQDRFELKRVIEETEGMPEQHAIHYAILRSMQKAIYSPKDVGHYALNSDAYCHFTSPIRRYPDLVIHRMIGDIIDGKKPNDNFDRLAAVGKHCSDLEKRASDAERELVKLKLLSFMSTRVGETLTAVVTGVESFGLFAQGVEIPAEGLVPIANLPDDKYSYEKSSRTLSGFRSGNQFRLGDMIEVIVAKVDLDERKLEYKFKGAKSPSDRPAKENRDRGGSRGRSDSRKRTDSRQSDSSSMPVEDRAKRGAQKFKPEKAKAKQSGAGKSDDKKSSRPARASDRNSDEKPRARKKSNKHKRRDPENWEEDRKTGMTTAQRKAKKKKKRSKPVRVESTKSKKAQAERKKAKAKGKSEARKAKVKNSKKKKAKAKPKRNKKSS